MNPISQVPHAPAGDSGAGGGSASSPLAQAKQTITQGARDATNKIKDAASDAASRARAEASRLAQEKKDSTAQRLGGYSSAMHDTAHSLEEQDPNIAWFTHRAADRIQGVADYVRSQDFRALRADAEDVARRHPAVFFGGLFLAGLMLGNVARPAALARDRRTMAATGVPAPARRASRQKTWKPRRQTSRSHPNEISEGAAR